MSSFFRLFSVRAASVACAAMLATGAASASVIFSENFSQAQTNSTNASYPTGLIDNTGFFVTAGSIDIGGSLAQHTVRRGLRMRPQSWRQLRRPDWRHAGQHQDDRQL